MQPSKEEICMKRTTYSREELRRRKIQKLTLTVFYGLSVAVLVWILASWVDLIAHNTNPSPIYQSWNLFNLIF